MSPATLVPSLDELARDPSCATGLPRSAMAALLVRVATVQSALAARLVDADADPKTSMPGRTEGSTQAMLTRKQVALRLAVSVATLDRMVDRGAFPKPSKLGAHSPRWSELTVAAWERKA
jgi:predicted DNA-binding transcriptional regulator AlpA